MNAEIKRKWAAALRSDEYKQAHRRLHTRDGFCCLGVLCDLHRKAHPDREWKWQPTGNFVYSAGLVLTGDSAFPPPDVRVWAGLDGSDPQVSITSGQTTLSALNDNLGLTFTEIAAIIEEQL